MELEAKVLASFDKNYQKAIEDGWTVNENKMFLPPKTHEAIRGCYAAYFFKTKGDIIVPSYFIKYYK